MIDQEREGTVLSGQQARQGEIVLRRRWQRLAFVSGLAAFVMLAMLAALVLHG
jgi:hypothetical protein